MYNYRILITSMKLHGQAHGISAYGQGEDLSVERNPAPRTIHPRVNPWSSGAWIANRIIQSRSTPKRMKYLLITIIIILSGALFLHGADAQTCRSEIGGYCAKLAAITQTQGLDELISTKEIGDIIPALYRFGLGLVGISALAALIVGGIMYMTAGGSQDQTKRARTWIGNAFFGLALALLSYLILNTINPDLVRRLDLRLESIRQESPEEQGFRESVNRCIYNQIGEECERLQRGRCATPTQDQSNPCYCIQNPTAGICRTSMF